MSQNPVMFRCSNQRCAHVFMIPETEEIFHDCGKCGQDAISVRPVKKSEVFGVPGTISAKTRGSDHALKSLASRYDMTDMGQRGGTRTGETAMLQDRNRALESGQSICTSTKSALAHSISVPAGGPRFQGGSKSLPTQVVAAHKG